MPRSIRSRRLAPSLLAASTLFAAAAGPALAETRPVDVVVPVSCVGPFYEDIVGVSVRVKGEVPTETTAGQPVALTNASVDLVTKFVDGSGRDPYDVMSVYGDSMAFAFEGGSPATAASQLNLVSKPVISLPLDPDDENSELRWTTPLTNVGTPSTVTSGDGDGDVTIRFGQIRFGGKLIPDRSPSDDDPTNQTCTPTADAPPIAVVENTASQPEPTPTPAPDPVVDYTANGSVTFASPNARGTMPFGGRLDDATFVRAAGTFTGNLSLSPASAGLTVGGFLPVTARLEFGVEGPLSGRWGNGPISAEAQVAVKVPRITTFGIQLGGGANCRAKDPSTLRLLGTSAAFDPATGGQLVGSLPIGPLVGCGILNGAVSPLLVGKGHDVAFNLRPVAATS